MTLVPINEIRLPRLPMQQAEWPAFQAWWQKVVEQIEASVTLGNDLVGIQNDATYLVVSLSAELANERVIAFTSGHLTGADGGGGGSYTISLASTAVTPGIYGSASQVGQFTVDQQGRLTLAANVTITPAAIGAAASSLTLTAGAGLTGGGNLTANRTFDVGAGTGIAVNANDVALDTTNARNVDHAAVTFTAGAGLTGGGTLEASRTFDIGAGTGITVNANDVQLDTSSTRNTDHASVSVTAGAGLTGGGDISATRTLDVGAGTGITVNANDVALDTSSTRNTDHASVTLTAGAGLTGGGDISANRTFAVGAGTGITVNADDIALTNVTDHGTYTPTLTNVTNVSSSTAGVCIYSRVGSTVTVSGQINVTPTASGASTVVGISLPIASNFAASTNAGGTAASAGAQQSGAIEGDSANDRAQMRYISVGTSGLGMFFSFQYRII